jgi:FdhE protein
VTDSLFRKWFAGSQPTDTAVESAKKELDRLAGARPALLVHCQWLSALLPDLFAGADTSLCQLDPDHARTRLQGGVPLLRGEQVNVDYRAFRQRWQRACAALQEQQGDGAADLALAMQRNELDPKEMTSAVLAGQPEKVRNRSNELGLDPGLATTLLRFTLFPLFTAIEASACSLRTGVIWERGYCPTCGSWPLLGEFRGLDQSRFLRCGLCAAGWEVSRQWCPYCGNRDHEQLGFLHCEGEETKYRCAFCDNCRSYVKMISTLFALSPLQMLVADVATLHLDLAAAERGYSNHF